MIAILKFLRKYSSSSVNFFFGEILKPNNYNNKKKALAKQVQSIFFFEKQFKGAILRQYI
jgi:hypothetical protein